MPQVEVPRSSARFGRTGKKDAVVSPRVLVVDFIDTADAISMALGLSGFETDAVYGGGSAIDVTAHWQPQIIVLDICGSGSGSLPALLRAGRRGRRGSKRRAAPVESATVQTPSFRREPRRNAAGRSSSTAMRFAFLSGEQMPQLLKRN